MSVAVEEPNIRVVIHGILHSEFQEVFGPYLVTDEHSSEQSRKSKLITLWKDIPKEKHGISLQYYMQEVQSQNNARCMLLLLTVLEELVANNTVDAKLVCDAVLSSDHLTWQDSTLWCASLELIQRIVGGVDYKGCRDLLRTILEKAKGVPSDANVVTIQVIDAVHKVVSYILNRNSCLLPSYFAVNEVTKFSNDDKNWQHWKLGSLLADFVQTFRLTAQMVTVAGRSHLYPIVGHSSLMSNVWKLNINSLCFSLSGPLPYDKELYKPQSKLLRYVLEQPYSRDMICTMLGLNKQGKQRCAVLEEHLVDLVVMAMERSEKMGDAQSNDDLTVSHLLWQHLSSQVIFFVLFQFASFPHIVMALYKKLKDRNLKTGRDHLMWVLLQFISGSIQKNQLSDFLPVMKLYDLLYPDQQLLPLPDITKSSSTYSMAVTSIWISLSKKAQTDNKKLQRPIPRALQAHVDFLNQTLSTKNFPMTDYTIALLCNAYSTSAELFMLPMGVLVENISGNVQDTIPLPGGLTASSPVQPLQMTMLDSLTVHAKMSLIHSIVTKVIQQAQAKSNVALSPALVETYSRLLVYMEIESLGIKGFISKVLPSVFKSNGWGILHTLLEIFSYRLHHIQPNYRLQLLGHLNTLSTVPQTNQTQLQICVESTALRLIMGLGSSEVQPQLSRMMSETRNSLFIFEKSEELNRALVLTLARAMHITGTESMSNTWWRDILTKIMHYTPHSWSSNTLACFPVSLQEFFAQNPITTDMATTLSCVPEEYRRWKSMASEADLIQHFTNPNAQPLFLCVLWKSLLDDSRISPTAYRVLERLGPRALSSHLRHFAEHLVNEFSAIPGGNHVNRCVEALNDMIWKCNIISIDRLVLCLALRNFEGTSEAQVRFFIIQLILLKQADFRNRVQAFIRDNSPEHWTLDNWHEKHIAFHNKFPEKFYYDGVQDMQGTQSQYLPIYFGNVCLRFLPVFDIVIHRFLELPAVLNSLEILLDHLGGLYKFHDRPITYLYNTLHYYERRLKDQIPLKKKLVLSIIGALKDNRPHNWCLTEQYLSYLEQPLDAPLWCPDQSYYVSTIKRLVDTMSNTIPPPFPHFDCRFNEFPNPSAHALYATCIELMALPVPSEKVGSAILDIVLERACSLPRESIMQWMNAIGLVLTALPESYWSVINDRLEQLLSSTSFSRTFPLHCLQLNFVQSHSVMAEHQCSYILAVCHAIWQHASIGQLTSLPVLLRTRLKPLISTEEQLLFICHLFGPFLQRFHIERTRCLLEIATELYEILRNVDKQCAHLNHMDEITDFLYHIKYMFVGDGIKNEVEKVICKLRPALQLRLRFISYHSKEENTAPVQTSANIKTIF